MIAILFNVLAIIVGSAIGAIAKRGISEKYITVLNTAMGLAALVLGINVAMGNMAKSHFPVLFIFCLSFGGLLGTMLRLDQRMPLPNAFLAMVILDSPKASPLQYSFAVSAPSP